MSVKKTTGAYNDCFRTMDKMVRGSGGVANFPTPQAATVFRHRCYRARKMLYKAAEESCPLGVIPSTPYDDLFIRHEPGDTKLVFWLRSLQLPEIEVNVEPAVKNHRQLDLDLE